MKRVVLSGAFMLIVLVVWEVVVRIAEIPEYLLPAPSAILVQLVRTLPDLLPHIVVTTFEALSGFVIAAVCGFGLAVTFIYSKTLQDAAYPYAIALKSVPVVAIAPLLIVWFGNGMLPKIIIAAIISFFPVLVNAVKGLSSIDREAFDLFDSLAASRTQVFVKLRLPTSLPYLFAALRISSTLAVIGAIVGEFAGADRGLGYFIVISSHRLNTVDTFVGIVLSAFLGIAAFYIVVAIERWFLAGQPKIEGENS